MHAALDRGAPMAAPDAATDAADAGLRADTIAINANAAPWDAAPPAAPLSWTTRWAIGWSRARRWEFWPAWLYYGPIVLWILALGLRHRSATLFTAANPALDNGGVVGERKHQGLMPLQHNAPDLVACFTLLPAEPGTAREQQALAFAARDGIGFPLVLKPDVGQRGRGVYIARDAAAVNQYLSRHDGAVIAQRHVGGEEFGVFIAQMPGQRLDVISIVHKTFPSVTGDGRRSLRELILAGERTRLIAAILLERWASQLSQVPADGQRIKLVEIGSHCRGSLFLDATAHATPALVDSLMRLTAAVPGYRFGRIDLRSPSLAHLQRGEGLQVLELNGVTAESAHIYHPGTPLVEGYRVMFRQWRLAFSIGAASRSLGAPVTSAFELLRLFIADQRRGRQWF